MKSPQKSRFGKLVTYLLDPQGKKETRVRGGSNHQLRFDRYDMGVPRNRRDAVAKHARQISSDLSSDHFAQGRRKP